MVVDGVPADGHGEPRPNPLENVFLVLRTRNLAVRPCGYPDFGFRARDAAGLVPRQTRERRAGRAGANAPRLARGKPPDLSCRCAHSGPANKTRAAKRPPHRI